MVHEVLLRNVIFRYTFKQEPVFMSKNWKLPVLFEVEVIDENKVKSRGNIKSFGKGIDVIEVKIGIDSNVAMSDDSKLREQFWVVEFSREKSDRLIEEFEIKELSSPKTKVSDVEVNSLNKSGNIVFVENVNVEIEVTKNPALVGTYRSF